MKTEKIEKLILLEQSGELNFLRRWQLRRAVDSDPAVKKFRDDLSKIIMASRESDSVGDLNPMVLGEIRKAATEQSEHSVPLDAIYGSWLRPAIAFAAILFIVGSMAAINQYRPPIGQKVAAHFAGKHAKWDDNIDAELSSVSSQIAANFDLASDSTAMDANSLARELLAIEGNGQ